MPLVAPCVLPVDELEEVDWVEVAEVDCVLEVEPLVVWDVCVELVALEVELPELGAVEEPVPLPALPVLRSFGATPPPPITVETPPVARI